MGHKKKLKELDKLLASFTELVKAYSTLAESKARVEAQRAMEADKIGRKKKSK